MMMKEFEALMSSVQTIENGIEATRKILDDLLSRSDKAFAITVNGKLYDFFPPTTDDEVERMGKLRRKFLNALLRRVISFNITDNNYGWEDILAFACGPDPKDFQYEKISVDQLYEITDENGSKIASLPLNVDSVYVKMQNPNLEDGRNDKQN